MAILDRLADEDPPLAHLLWTSLCNVRLWAETTAGERHALFRPQAGPALKAALAEATVDASLAGALRVVGRMLSKPASVRATRVGRACRDVAVWAQEHDTVDTALEFFQAAALADPSDADAAYHAGRLARGRAEYARAESWFDEALRRSREQADWSTYGRTYTGIGNMHHQRGNFPRAVAAHLRARKVARRYGVREVEAMACHDLFAIAQTTPDVDTAEQLAADAFRLYGAGHSRLPILAHDVACFWADQGRFWQARGLLQAVLPHMPWSQERLLALGNLARACGAVGDPVGYEGARKGVWAGLTEHPLGELTAMAVLGVGDGARSLGWWTDAEAAANRAWQIAAERKELRAQFMAEALQESIRTAVRAQASTSNVEVGRPSEALDPLTGQFVEALARLDVGAR